MAEHFAGHPAIMGYQIDNELGMYGMRCYCDRCVAGSRQWLQERYGTIEALNEQLGIIFGGSEYRDFADVPLPQLGMPNPSSARSSRLA